MATRNILIGENNMAKISDFGLARDIKGIEEYAWKNHVNYLTDIISFSKNGLIKGAISQIIFNNPHTCKVSHKTESEWL